MLKTQSMEGYLININLSFFKEVFPKCMKEKKKKRIKEKREAKEICFVFHERILHLI